MGAGVYRLLRQAIEEDPNPDWPVRSRLIFLDADKIPELVIRNDEAFFVYAYRNGQPEAVVELGIGATSVGFEYKPYSNIVVQMVAGWDDEKDFVWESFYNVEDKAELYMLEIVTVNGGNESYYIHQNGTSQAITKEQYDAYHEGFSGFDADSLFPAGDILWQLETFQQ